MKVQLLSTDPEVVLFGDFISRDEARALLALAEGNFASSRVTCEKAGGCVSDYRTSATANLPMTRLTQEIATRGMRLARLPFAEELQVVRYFPGQEFKPHVDAFDPATFSGRQELAGYGGRQRDATFLIYLNDVEGGGSTRFEKIGVEVEPKAGAALYWRNVVGGKIDHRTMHQGMPVTSGVKYAVNLWIRGAQALAGFGTRRDARKVSSIPSLRNFQIDRAAIGRRRLGRLGLAGKNFLAGEVAIEKLGKLEFKLGDFPPAAGVDGRVTVAREKYSGTTKTLLKMASFIREGSVSPAMRQFAEMVIQQAGVPKGQHISNRRAAEIMLSYVKANVRYRPDPDNQELVQSPFVTLCVPGAQICIPIEDCDGLTVALGSLIGAYGIPVRIMKQNFGADAEEEHVLLVFKTDEGKWLAADPSAPPQYGVGWRAEAHEENIIDPLDPSGTGKLESDFIAIGGLKIELTMISSEVAVPGGVRAPPRQVLTIGASAHDTTVALQTRLEDLALATALAIEACRAGTGGPGSGLSTLQQAQWTDLAQRILTFVSADPDTADVVAGQNMAVELVAWGDVLRAAGCAAPVPAPVPTPAPVPPAGDQASPASDFIGLGKLALYTLMAGVGVYGLTQLVEMAKIGAEIEGAGRKHLAPASAEARRLIRRSRRRAA